MIMWSATYLRYCRIRAIPKLKRLVAGFPLRRSGFDSGSGQVGFVVDKVSLGRVFSEYFGFPYQSYFLLTFLGTTAPVGLGLPP
jgi:hypothetical protein